MENNINKETLPYRKNVGIGIVNNKNQVFVGKRINDSHGFIENNKLWQMPQGGVDDNEDLFDACLRELEEETSIKNVKLIGEIPYWINYDLPDEVLPKFWNGKYRGQTQKWFLLRFIGNDNEINLVTSEPEFSEWKWVEFDELFEMVVPFKLNVYKMVIEEFKKLL